MTDKILYSEVARGIVVCLNIMFVLIVFRIYRKTGEMRAQLARSRIKDTVDRAGHSGQLNLRYKIRYGILRYLVLLCRILMIRKFLVSAALLELWRQLMHKHLGKSSLCLSNNLLIVLALLTILVAMAVCHHRLLNMSSTMEVWILKRLIHTRARMVNAISLPKMLVFKFVTPSISPL